jgi:hypothetical protein
MFALIFIVWSSFLKPERTLGIHELVQADTKRAAIRSSGCGFSLRGAGLCSFPSLNISKTPTATAGCQLDRAGKGWISSFPPADGQMMHAKARAKLSVGEEGFRHMRLHTEVLDRNFLRAPRVAHVILGAKVSNYRKG